MPHRTSDARTRDCTTSASNSGRQRLKERAATRDKSAIQPEKDRIWVGSLKTVAASTSLLAMPRSAHRPGQPPAINSLIVSGSVEALFRNRSRVPIGALTLTLPSPFQGEGSRGSLLPMPVPTSTLILIQIALRFGLR